MDRTPPRRIDVSGSVQSIAETANWIETEARAAGVHSDATYALLVCAEELMANIVRHGRRPEPMIGVSIEFLPGRARLTVEDDGPPFDVAAAPPHRIDQPLDEVQAGGLGIGLIRTFSSAVTYERAGDINRVVVDIDVPASPAIPA